MSRLRLRFFVPVLLALVAPLVIGIGAVGAATSSPPRGTCQPLIPFRASNFGQSTRIDNQFLPLAPGVQTVLEGRSNTGGGVLPHTVVFTVTDLVKQISGVYSLTVLDIDIDDGKTSEAELSFWAQDKDGNVWNLGEYPEEYDNGKFTGAPATWFNGLQGAIGGLHMLADPRLGTPRYLQGYSPSIDFLDCAQVYAHNQSVCVPVSCYSGVLITDETSPLEDPNAHQRKYHAPGVGIVEVTAVNDPEGETLVLVQRRSLDSRELMQARQDALKLEQHAYRTNPLYQQTLPMFTASS
jgi:hypothetical protein